MQKKTKAKAKRKGKTEAKEKIIHGTHPRTAKAKTRRRTDSKTPASAQKHHEC